MGATHPQNEIYGESNKTLKYLKKLLNLNENEIKEIWKIFSFYDLQKISFINFDEFCTLVHCEEDKFLKSLFEFFSSTKYYKLTFSEFILFCYFYLTLTEENLAEYLFIIITDNYRIKATHETIEDHIIRLFGNAWGNENNIHHVLNVIDHDLNGEVTLNEFKNGLKLNRSLLFSIVSYQTDIREKIISRSYWEERENIGSMLIRSIRDIRRELHKLEEEEYSLYGPTNGIEVRKLERRLPSQEIIDPSKTTIPTSIHHNNNHFKSTNLIEEQKEKSHMIHNHRSDSIDESKLQHDLPNISTPTRPTTSIPSNNSHHHNHNQNHHYLSHHNSMNSESQNTSPIKYLPEIVTSHTIHDHSISPSSSSNHENNHILHPLHYQNSTIQSSSLSPSKLPSPDRYVSPHTHQKLSNIDKESHHHHHQQQQEQQQEHGSSQIHSLQRLRLSHNDYEKSSSNDYTIYDSDSKVDNDHNYKRIDSISSTKEDEKITNNTRLNSAHKHHHHHHDYDHKEIKSTKLDSKDDSKQDTKD